MAATQQGLPAELKNELFQLGIGQIRSVMKHNQPDIPISDDKVTCAICMEDLEVCHMGYKNAIFTPCGHPFHPNCISRILDNKCPVCREGLSNADMDNMREGAQNLVEAEEERDDINFA